jgi:hypothetical protein
MFHVSLFRALTNSHPNSLVLIRIITTLPPPLSRRPPCTFSMWLFACAIHTRCIISTASSIYPFRGKQCGSGMRACKIVGVGLVQSMCTAHRCLRVCIRRARVVAWDAAGYALLLQGSRSRTGAGQNADKTHPPPPPPL